MGPDAHRQRELLLMERRHLESHVRRAGADLIIDPWVEPRGMGAHGAIARLETLRQLLKSAAARNVRVVVRKGCVEGNLTVLGDWFAAEAAVPFRGAHYRGTVFTKHAPSVLAQVEEFDEEFRGELPRGRVTPEDLRDEAVRQIDLRLTELREPLPED